VPGTPLVYQDINVLLPLGREWVELDPVGDLAEASGLQIELLVREDARDVFDLETLDDELERVGERLTLLSPGARWSAQVIADVGEGDTAFFIDADLAGHSYPRLMWIGHEAVWVTAAEGDVADPADEDAYRLTVVRGVAGTKAARYDATPELLDYHVIYSDMVSWRRRRAVLEVSPVWGIPDEKCMVPDDGWMDLPNGRGFIEAAPEPPRGHDISIKMRLHPLSSLIDTEVEVPTTIAGLVQGVHQFEGRNGRVFEWAVRTPRVTLEATHDVTVADSGEISAPAERHSEAFDLSLPTARLADGRRFRHPRRSRLKLGNQVGQGGLGFVPTGYASAGLGPIGGEAIEIEAGPTRDAPAGTEVYSAQCVELRRVIMPPGVQEWPGTFIDLVNASTTESTQGLDGAHARLTIAPGESGWSAVVTSNLGDLPMPEGGVSVLLWDPWESDNPARAVNGRDTMPWPGGYQPEPHVVWDAGGFAGGRAREIQQLFSYPMRYRVGDSGRDQSNGVEVRGTRAEWLELNSDHPFPYARVFEFATAYYQTGERGVLVNTEVTPPPEGQVLHVDVEWSVPWLNDRLAQTIAVTDVEEIALPDGGTAWYLVLQGPHLTQSFGDWGGEACTLKLSPVSRTGGVMLERLFRDYVGIDDDEINIPSFRHVPDPPGMVFTVPAGREPVTLREITHGPLVATGTALVMRTDQTGRSKLTRVPVGIQTVHESILHITDALCVEPPTYGAERETISRIIISSAYGDDGEPTLVQRFHNRGAGAESGGDGETLELELRSVIDVTQRTMLAVAQRIFTLRSRSRRLWFLTIPLGWGYDIFPGAVVQLTSDFVRGYGEVGVDGLFGRVRRVEHDHRANTTSLVVVHHTKNGTGWNTALKIESIISPTRLEVSAGPWSPTDHPVTGLPFDVWSLWATGYSARIVPYGDHDAGPQLGIDVIDTATNQIEFDGPHGLVAVEGLPLGEVEPPEYHLANPVQQQLAWLTDAAGRLGVDGPEGFVAV